MSVLSNIKSWYLFHIVRQIIVILQIMKSLYLSINNTFLGKVFIKCHFPVSKKHTFLNIMLKTVSSERVKLIRRPVPAEESKPRASELKVSHLNNHWSSQTD